MWWTQAGDARDHLLRAGQRLTVQPADRVVFQAVGGAGTLVEGAG